MKGTIPGLEKPEEEFTHVRATTTNRISKSKCPREMDMLAGR
jgi:hypothetical protein